MLKGTLYRTCRILLYRRGLAVLQGMIGSSLLLGCGILSYWQHDEEQRVADLQSESQQLAEQIHTLEQAQRQQSSLAKAVMFSPRQNLVCWAERLSSLVEQLPESCWLRVINAEHSLLHLQGSAAQPAILYQFEKRLRTLPQVLEVTFGEISHRDESEVTFALTLSYQGETCGLG